MSQAPESPETTPYVLLGQAFAGTADWMRNRGG